MLHKGTISSCYCPMHVRDSYKILAEIISNNMKRFSEKVKRFHLEYHQNRSYYSCLTGKKTEAQRSECSTVNEWSDWARDKHTTWTPSPVPSHHIRVTAKCTEIFQQLCTLIKYTLWEMELFLRKLITRLHENIVAEVYWTPFAGLLLCASWILTQSKPLLTPWGIAIICSF